MMLPVPRLFMPGRKLLIVRNVAVRLASRSARQLSSPISSIGPGRLPLPPAQATNTLTRPYVCSTRPNGRDVGELRDVAGDKHGVAAAVGDVGLDLRQGFGISAVEDDLRAVSGERYCDFRPDAARASGHEDHFAVQVVIYPPCSARGAGSPPIR
jgi:hypothetical protein